MVNRRRYLDLGAGRAPIDITSLADLEDRSSSSSVSEPIDIDGLFVALQELAQLPPVAVAAHIAADVARALEARLDASATHLNPDRPSTTVMGLIVREHPEWPTGRVRFLMSDGTWRGLKRAAEAATQGPRE